MPVWCAEMTRKNLKAHIYVLVYFMFFFIFSFKFNINLFAHDDNIAQLNVLVIGIAAQLLTKFSV